MCRRGGWAQTRRSLQLFVASIASAVSRLSICCDIVKTVNDASRRYPRRGPRRHRRALSRSPDDSSRSTARLGHDADCLVQRGADRGTYAPHELARSRRDRRRAGNYGAVSGVEPRAQRADSRGNRRLLAGRPEREFAGVAVPCVHCRPARCDGRGADHLFLARLAAYRDRPDHQHRAPERTYGRPAAGLVAGSRDDPGRFGGARRRTLVPHHTVQACADRDLHHDQRLASARRGGVAPPRPNGRHRIRRRTNDRPDIGSPVGSAAGRPGDAHWVGTDSRVGTRYFSIGRDHGRWHAPRLEPRGRSQVLLPARHAGHPRGRCAQARRSHRAARRRRSRASAVRVADVGRGRVPVGAVLDAIPRQPVAAPVRHLLPRPRGGLPDVVHSALTYRRYVVRRFGFLLGPRWLALHIVVVAACVTMVLLGRWQWRVAHVHHGSVQNYSYAFQWWAFTVFAVFMWLRLVHDAAPQTAAARSSADEGGAERVNDAIPTESRP